MGGADIVPGVSGGTVALILGVYERLVTAISRFDLTFLAHLRAKRWRDALEHVDLRFLLALGAGVVLGIGGLANLMHWLLENHAVPTWSFLFGLILASSILVATMVRKWNPATAVALGMGAWFAYWLVGQLPAVPPSGYGYVFLCGALAICAMILPGISGAFVLVIMGMYLEITGVLRALLHGEITPQNVTTVAVFCLGCGLGLLSFSKFLRWLLEHYEAVTMATLCGFMLGSLRKIWPFKKPATVEQFADRGWDAETIAELDQKFRLGDNYLPSVSEPPFLMFLVLVLAASAAVFALDRLGRRTNSGN